LFDDDDPFRFVGMGMCKGDLIVGFMDEVLKGWQTCSLGLLNNELACMGSEDTDDEDFTAERCANLVNPALSTACWHSTSVYTIFGDERITAFHAGAFLKFGGTLHISGRFSHMTHIHPNAFQGCAAKQKCREGQPDGNTLLNAASTIEFGDMDLPVLVEIGSNAFKAFAGKVVFINNPFPRLQFVRIMSFADMSHPQNRIELIDQQALVKIGTDGFFNCGGVVILRGNLKSLRIIEAFAFQYLTRRSSYTTSNTSSIIELRNLPSLTAIEHSAFEGYQGRLEVSGLFPALESLGALSFANIRNATIDLSEGAPSLRCVAADAFASLQGSYTVKLTGAFPCWNVQPEALVDFHFTAGPDDKAAKTWNTITSFPAEGTNTGQFIDPLVQAGDSVKTQVEFDIGVGGCSMIEALQPELSTVCHSINTSQHACRAPYMDDTLMEPCIESIVLDDRAPIPLCSLGMKGGQMVCVAEATPGEDRFVSDCNEFVIEAGIEAKANAACGTLLDVLTVGTRDDIVEIAPFAFAFFPGAIRIAGDFKSLTHIGAKAFWTKQNPTYMNRRSSIMFGM
jgi:hypothetical protein